MAAGEALDVGTGITQELDQGLDGGIERNEDVAGEDLAPDLRRVVAGLGEVAAIGAVDRRGEELAVGPERPGVVEAGEAAGTGAARQRGKDGAAMGAGVDEGRDLTVAAAGDGDRPAGDGGGDVVAGIGQLAFVGDPLPGGGEEALPLGLVDPRIDIDAAVDDPRAVELQRVVTPDVVHGLLRRRSNSASLADCIPHALRARPVAVNPIAGSAAVERLAFRQHSAD